MRDPAPARPLLAYKDGAFLEGDAARPVRILSEYLAPLEVLQREHVHDTIVFFGSARMQENGPLGRYYAAARELACLVSGWSHTLPPGSQRFVVCTGGGGGIMEAANRGAADAGERTIGLNIALPQEQAPNPYVTPELCFEFHYFFMRKLWFAHLARALIAFPGGFGTLDELFGMLTLAQTGKLDRKPMILLYGTEYWKEVIDFDALVGHGMIAPEDLTLFRYADQPQEALEILQAGLTVEAGEPTPAFAKSLCSCPPTQT